MDPLSLKIFRDIVREKSFVRAAKINHITQPAVSAHLMRLEEELGASLLNRVPRKISLTPEGELLLPHIEDVLVRMDNLKNVLSVKREDIQGTLRVATVNSIGVYEFAPFLKQYIHQYPEVQLELLYAPSSTIYGLVDNQEVDLGLIAYPKSHPNLSITIFGSDQLILIVPPEHPFTEKKSIRMEEIQGENFIAFDRKLDTGRAIEHELVKRGIEVRVRITNDNIAAIKRAVEVDLGIAIVPERSVKGELAQGTIKAVKLRDAKMMRPLGIVTKNKRILNYPAQLFIQHLS